MTSSYVLMQNLKRNPLRTALTALAFAFPMGIFVAAISLVTALNELSAANEQALRLGVHHKTTLTNLLPDGMRRKIEALDPDMKRIRAVCGMRWFGGRVPDTQNTLTSLGADVDTFPTVYSEIKMTPQELDSWKRDRQAAIVGLGPVETYGWEAGDRVVLDSTVPPYLSLEFHIVKIIENKERSNFFYFRRDYLKESRDEAGASSGRCNIFWIKCATADGLRTMQGDIDALFANSPDETKTEDENAFIANFTKAAGDIPGLMKAMAIVVVLIVALVAGNTMMMSFRERMRELAVFKAIGFQARKVSAIVLAESVLLALVGSLMGIVPVSVLLTLFPPQRLGMGPISTLSISPAGVIGSIVIALLVGLVAGAWPAYQTMRLNTVDALRKVA